MRKIILLSFLTLIPFLSESLAMENDQDEIEEKSVSSKRKLDSQSQRKEEPIFSGSVAKKPK